MRSDLSQAVSDAFGELEREDEREDRQLSHEDLRCQYLLHESVWYLVKSGGPKRTRVVVASRGGKKYSYGQECWLDTATLLEQLRRQRTSSDAPHYDDLKEEAGEGGDCFCGNTDEPAEGTKWIECDECLKWCHLSCTELGKSQPGDKDRRRYVCPRCSDADDLEGGADGSRKKRARKTAAPPAPLTNENRRIVFVDTRSGSTAALVPGKAGASPTLPDVSVATIERDLTGVFEDLDWGAARKVLFASFREHFDQAFRSGPTGHRVTVKSVHGIGVVAVTWRLTLTVPSSPPPRHPNNPLPHPTFIIGASKCKGQADRDRR